MKRVVAPKLLQLRLVGRTMPPGGMKELLARNPEWINSYTVSILFIISSFMLGFINRSAWVVGGSWSLYLLCSFVITLRRCQNIYLSRSVISSEREGEMLSIKYKIENRGGFSIREFFFDDNFDGVRGNQWRFHNTEKLKSSRSRNLIKEVPLDNGMGVKKFGDLTLYFWDPIGIFVFKVHFSFNQKVIVLPLVTPFPHDWEKPQEETPNFGGLELPKKGDSTNFVGIREYREGDPLRYINWMASQRTDTLLVNEFDRMVDAHTTLFINNDLSINSGEGAMSSFEYIKDLGLTIAQDQLEKGNELRLVTIDEVHHMGAGDDFFRFLEGHLCTMNLRDIGKEKKRGVAKKFYQLVPRGGTLIYLSPIHHHQYLKSDMEILKTLKSMDREVIVILINPYPELYKEIEGVSRILVAGLLEGAKRHKVVIGEELSKMGIFSHTIDVNSRIPFKNAIAQVGLKHLLHNEVTK